MGAEAQSAPPRSMGRCHIYNVPCSRPIAATVSWFNTVRLGRLVREPRRPANTGEKPGNTGPRDRRFARVRGCSVVWREVVGSGRILPITSAHVELRAFRKLPAWAERDRMMCEISRIAARPREQGVPYSWIGFIFGAEWLLRHTELRRYIAYARADLVQLYGVVGAREIGMRFQIPARGSAVYSVLTGSLEETVTKGVGLLAEAATKAEVAKIAAGEDIGSAWS
jgi:hypothetical protein